MQASVCGLREQGSRKVEEIIAATGFELLVPDEVEETRMPTEEELKLIREVIDPHGLRKAEFVKK